MTEFFVRTLIGCISGLLAYLALRRIVTKWRGANAASTAGVPITIIALLIGLLVSRVGGNLLWPTERLDGQTRSAAEQVLNDVQVAWKAGHKIDLERTNEIFRRTFHFHDDIRTILFVAIED